MAAQDSILIDVTRLIWRVSTGRLPTGIDRVCLAYLEHYVDHAQAVFQWKSVRRILPRSASAALFKLLLNPPKSRFKLRVAFIALRSLPRLFLPLKGGNRLYLNVGHTGLNEPGLGEWLKQAGVRPVFMLYDLIPITHPEYSRSGEGERHVDRLNTMLRAGVGIVCISQDTLNRLNDHAAAYGLAVPATLVSWLGVTPLPSAKAYVEPKERPYFLILSTIEGRKNHLMLLKVWQRLVARYGSDAPRLVIVGQRGWENEEALDILDNDESLHRHVTELPRCTDWELAAYIKGARSLLFPTFAEGFGLPLMEALGLGAPVIASNLKVFRELAGDIPDYLDPHDEDGWLRAIEDYRCPDSAARLAQLKRVKDYEMPTWAKHFAKVDSWLIELSRKEISVISSTIMPRVVAASPGKRVVDR